MFGVPTKKIALCSFIIILVMSVLLPEMRPIMASEGSISLRAAETWSTCFEIFEKGFCNVNHSGTYTFSLIQLLLFFKRRRKEPVVMREPLAHQFNSKRVVGV